MPAESLDYKPGPERWSIREIIIHIVEADILSFIRFGKPLAEPGSTFPLYDPDLWIQEMRASTKDIPAALALLKVFRGYLVPLFESLIEEQWSLKAWERHKRGEWVNPDQSLL